MKVLFTLALPDGTGAHRMAHHFILGCRHAGWEVTLVAGRIVEPGDLSPAARAMLGGLESAGVEVRFERGFQSLWSPGLVRRLTGLARGCSALIGVNQRDRKYALWAGGRMGLPVVLMVQNQHRFHGPPPVRRLKAALYGRMIRRAQLLVCPSRVVQEELVMRFGVAPERTALLPNGIATDRFSLERSPGPRAWAALGVGPEDLVAVNVGRLDRQKGQDLLLEAFSRVAGKHPRLRLGLIGAASLTGAAFEATLRERARELGLAERVIWAGWQDDIPRFLRDADLYVHSARWEGLSLAVLEALACALPAVTTDCSGRLEGFVEGEHGWTVAAGSVEELAEALDRLACLDPEERRRMGRAGRELVARRYDVDRELAPAFVRLVERAINSSS